MVYAILRSLGRVFSLGLVLVVAFGCALFPSQRAWAQTSSDVTIDSNPQLFAVMTALNMAGCDAGLFVNTGDKTRQQVRAYLAKKKIPVTPELTQFYSKWKSVSGSGEDLTPYFSLALLLGPPPRFSFTIPEQDLPPDARSVKGFAPLVRTFYQQADLGDLYARLRPRFLAVIRKYAPGVRRRIAFTDGYLRFPSASYLGRHYHIYVCLMGPPNEVQLRIYGEKYYTVITPSVQPQFHEILYQYLHFILDPLAVKYGREIDQKAALRGIIQDAPSLNESYKDDFSFLVTECLVRAVQLRINHPSNVSKVLSKDLRSGLILAPYFYSQLAIYEQQPASMQTYFDRMVQGIDVKKMEQKLASVPFSAPKARPSQKSPALSQKDMLLNRGDNLIYLGQYAQAKQVFQTVLKEYDPKSEQALYGLAVVASNTGAPDIAVEYFRKTLAVAHSLRIVTWSHIYMGRIYDLEGYRQKALAQYHAAAVTAANFPDALRAVNTGLQHPFSGGS